MPRTLLLADDSITIQRVVGITFANEDFEIVTVDNGDDAVTRARELKPEIILADVIMPKKNGYEVCEAIKSDPELKDTPVLLLAGTFEAFDENRAQEVGADGHVTKPFESQALINKVKELIGAVPSPAMPSPLQPVSTYAPPPAAAPAYRPAAAAAPPTSTPRPAAVQPPGAARTTPPAGVMHPPAAAAPRVPRPITPAAPRPAPGAAMPAPAAAPPRMMPPTSPELWEPTPLESLPLETAASEPIDLETRSAPALDPLWGAVPAKPSAPPLAPPRAAPSPPIDLGPAAPFGKALPARPQREAPAGVRMPSLDIAEEGLMERSPEPMPTHEFAPKPRAVGKPPEPARSLAASREEVERIAREVIEKIAWEVVPQLAEGILREEIDKLVKEKLSD